MSFFRTPSCLLASLVVFSISLLPRGRSDQAKPPYQCQRDGIHAKYHDGGGWLARDQPISSDISLEMAPPTPLFLSPPLLFIVPRSPLGPARPSLLCPSRPSVHKVKKHKNALPISEALLVSRFKTGVLGKERGSMLANRTWNRPVNLVTFLVSIVLFPASSRCQNPGTFQPSGR